MTNVLFGNLLAISREQLATFAVLLVLLAACIGFIYRPCSIPRSTSRSPRMGLPVRLLSMIFAGAAQPGHHHGGAGRWAPGFRPLIVTPPPRDHADQKPPRRDHFTVISVVSVWLGVAMSAMFNLPPASS